MMTTLVAAPRWYVLNKLDMATLCADAADAARSVKAYDHVYPRVAPHRAAQLVDMETLAEAVAAEREACAQVAEEYLDDPLLSGHGYATGCAAAIRQRVAET